MVSAWPPNVCTSGKATRKAARPKRWDVPPCAVSASSGPHGVPYFTATSLSTDNIQVS